MVVITRYSGKNGIYDGTNLFADIITNVERIHGKKTDLLKMAGATESTRNINLRLIGGSSGEFHVDNNPNNGA